MIAEKSNSMIVREHSTLPIESLYMQMLSPIDCVRLNSNLIM
jgi:hypothetical protein